MASRRRDRYRRNRHSRSRPQYSVNDVGFQTLEAFPDRDHAVLFDRPEFGDAEKIRRYLSAFEEKQKLLELLEQTLLADGVQVFIGSEAALDGVGDISVISSPYRRDGASIGSFGIVGPTRMDYKKYVPLVGFAADVLSDILDGRLPGASKDS